MERQGFAVGGMISMMQRRRGRRKSVRLGRSALSLLALAVIWGISAFDGAAPFKAASSTAARTNAGE
jgi:hypothetical protein